jgi:carboxypeptidase PM20D1
VYLVFGHDEEVLGNAGAAEISRLLNRRGISLAYVLDEGGFIRTDVMPGVKKPAAMVGVAEKGYLTLDLTVKGAGGHSSMPQRRTAVGRLSAALCRLEKKRFPARITAPVRSMFEHLGPEAEPPYRYAYTNIWLFKPVLMNRIAASPQSDAMIRTTIAPTMMKGSEKENMMPVSASAVVNFRILPGDTRESVTARVKSVISDPGVMISVRDNSCDPSPVSDIHSPEFIALKNTIADLFPDTVVTPFLMVGATDSRHFASLSRQIFRFNPALLDSENMERIHGTNERISVENFADFITFYIKLIRRTAC